VPQVVYIDADGQQTEIDAAVGDSVMETAVQNGVEGIGGVRGSLFCSTCHVYVDPQWAPQLEPMDEMEDEMREGTDRVGTPAEQQIVLPDHGRRRPRRHRRADAAV